MRWSGVAAEAWEEPPLIPLTTVMSMTAAIANFRTMANMLLEPYTIQRQNRPTRRESAGSGSGGYGAGVGVISVWGVETFQGTIGMSGCGLASGDASSTAIAPRSAPVRE